VQGFPFATRGQRIGLLGGSFDPPHSGHVHITHEALRRFNLDRVWWLVSPGNPLKLAGPAPMARRLAVARAMMHDPRVVVSDVEARIGTRYTAQTIKALRARYRGVRFVWLMGADNLASFHRWDRWRDILGQAAVGVVARPGWGLPALHSVTARAYAGARLPEGRAPALADQAPPAWCYIRIPMQEISSTDLRERGGWGG
jgi:nicotinate-nucleotide adenylyltransferase